MKTNPDVLLGEGMAREREGEGRVRGDLVRNTPKDTYNKIFTEITLFFCI